MSLLLMAKPLNRCHGLHLKLHKIGNEQKLHNTKGKFIKVYKYIITTKLEYF